jgi:hypothetical protein
MIRDIFLALILIFLSLNIRFFLSLFKQKWVESISHTSTIVMLPIITFVITKVISGNIALSLGMVGALSIVRFRNPVRSSLELTIYFLSIAMGISAAVSLKWLLFLNIALIISVLTLYSTSKIYEKVFRKKFFFTTFNEGNSFSSIEIKSNQIIDFLENSDYLKSKYFSNNINKYLLISNDFNHLKEITKRLNNDERIIDYELNE